jgi:hypothetical protein
MVTTRSNRSMIQAIKNISTPTALRHDLQNTIDACVAAAQACEACTATCLHEKNIQQLADCLRYTNDCAQACWAAASYISRDSAFIDGACEIALKSCELCARECIKHDYAHCQVAAAAALKCAIECRRIVGG